MTAHCSPYKSHRDGALVDVVVQPRASKTEIIGLHDGALRIRVAAPPVDGAANAAIIELIAKRVGVRKNDIEILAGASSRRKRMLVRGVTVERVREALNDS